MVSKTVLITGATRGIGRAILEKFSNENYNIICVYKSSHEIAHELSKHPNITCFSCDISNETEVFELAEKLSNTKIDVLVNNASISHYKLFTETTNTDYNSVFDTNVKGSFFITQAFSKQMIANQKGSIINISSMWGEIGASMEVLYSASKGAIIAFTKALAKELGLSNIRANCITPGVIKTDMLSSFDSETLDTLKNETPLNRLGKPEDIANLVYFLAEDSSSFITGQIIGVNGGYNI